MIGVAEDVICGAGHKYPHINDAVKDVKNRFGHKLLILCAKLDYSKQCIKKIAEIEFEDGKVSYGRIVALCAFAKVLATLYPSKRREIANEVDDFVKSILCKNKNMQPCIKSVL